MAKKSEEGRLENNKQKGLKTCSKILSVFAILGRVCLWIALPIVIICFVAIPLLLKDVTIDRTGFAFKNEKVNLVENEEGVELKYKNYKIADIKAGEKDILYKAIDKYSNKKMIAIVEVALGGAIISLIIGIIVLKRANKLFDNINEKETPFVEENVGLIRNIAYLMLAEFVVSIVIGGVLEVISSGILSYSMNFSAIFTFLLVFGSSYIFEYGCSLQEETKEKIYD